MSAQSETTVSIPDNISLEQAKAVVLRALDKQGVEYSSEVTQEGDRIVIEGMTSPSLLSWGTHVTVLLEPDKITVTGENSQQKNDWGKTRDNIEGISENLRTDMSQPAGNLA